MPIRLDRLRKVESGSLPNRPTTDPEKVVEIIVKVREADYVPPGVTPRARIDAFLFTCSVRAALLPILEQDPKVVAISINQTLHNG